MNGSLDSLSKFLEISPALLGAMVFKTELFYTELKIKKKNGGTRLLSVPNDELRNVQSKIYREVLSPFVSHDSAQAYVKKKSILTNANEHLSSKVMLKMDLTDFFGSTRYIAVVNKFIQIAEIFHRKNSQDIKLRFSDDECRYLAKLCTLGGGLPQGAITSPHLSNLIFYKIDQQIQTACQKRSVTYTRYSDDMIFSSLGEDALYMEKTVKRILAAHGYRVNPCKTSRLLANRPKYVTGLAIENEIVRLPKKRRRELRQELHEFKADSNLANTIIRAETKSKLIGKFSFWCYIEPSNRFALDALTYLKGA